MITLCKTCGTSYDTTPARCAICDDERQYVPIGGQQWVDYDSVARSHTNKWQQLEPGLLSLKTVPKFAINQRAILLQTPHGNVLWDCIATLDPATLTLIKPSEDSRPSRFPIRITTPPCRTGRRRLTPRFTSTPATGSG